MRFLLRLASFLTLVIGILAACVDAIQSVSASLPVLTPLGSAVAATGFTDPDTILSLERTRADPQIWDTPARWLLAQPAFAVLFVIAFALWVLSYRRNPIAGRFST